MDCLVAGCLTFVLVCFGLVNGVVCLCYCSVVLLSLNVAFVLGFVCCCVLCFFDCVCLVVYGGCLWIWVLDLLSVLIWVISCFDVGVCLFVCDFDLFVVNSVGCLCGSLLRGIVYYLLVG